MGGGLFDEDEGIQFAEPVEESPEEAPPLSVCLSQVHSIKHGSRYLSIP